MAELLILLGVITFIISLLVAIFSDDKEKYRILTLTSTVTLFCVLMIYNWTTMFDYKYYESYKEEQTQVSTFTSDIVDNKRTTTTVLEISCRVFFYKDYYYASDMIDISISKVYPGACNREQTHKDRNKLVWNEYFKELN